MNKSFLNTSVVIPATRQADAESSASTGPIEEAARTKIANRLWINDAGEECTEEEATGVQYEFLGRTKDGVVVPKDGKSFTLRFSDLTPPALHMLAGFGAMTLMGNVTNTWLGDKGDKASTAHDAIQERIALLNEGKWIDRTRDGVGAKVDKDVLAEAIIQVMIAGGKLVESDAAKVGDTKSTVRQKLEDDANWAKEIRKAGPVAAKYAELMGRGGKSVDELLAGL